MRAKIYRGKRNEKTGKQWVTVLPKGSRRAVGDLLKPDLSQKLRNHSPDGFNWGYGGSGPAQLALAILLDVCGKGRALQLYQQFVGDVVARLPRNEWEISSIEIEYWLGDRKRGLEYFAAKFDGDRRQ
jgi:hypothetical protein